MNYKLMLCNLCPHLKKQTESSGAETWYCKLYTDICIAVVDKCLED